MTSKLQINKSVYSLILFSLFLLSACRKDKIPVPIVSEPKTYLHLSHTRTNANPLMDSIAEQLNFAQFDMLWLGGDLALLTSADDQTMNHIDSVFDIGSPHTFWALGNHDYTDLNRIEAYTQRMPYYASNKNGITVLVLDTQDSLSHIVGDQMTFFNSVIDTLEKSTHLIILHHKLIWMYDNAHLEPQISSVSNGNLGDCFYCINPNNFNSEIYPKLVELEEKGIEVLCIGGDIGFKASEFEYITAEGINFMASGINAGSPTNKALLFSHNLADQTLTWEFKSLTDF